MKPPFNTNTPLSLFPYNSRNGENEFSQFSASKNYILHGFKPGNALQASELNEIQENFYKNLTLHNILLKNWLFIGSQAFVSGVATQPIRGPSWSGAVPLDPFRDVNFSDNVISFKKGWYLVDDFSGIKFWIYNNTERSIPVPPSGSFIGLTISKKYINGDEDIGLRDNSNGYDSSISMGADRYQLQFNGIFSSTNPAEPNQLKILKRTENNIHYINNLLLASL
jgi:hypothetical protein